LDTSSNTACVLGGFDNNDCQSGTMGAVCFSIIRMFYFLISHGGEIACLVELSYRILFVLTETAKIRTRDFHNLVVLCKDVLIHRISEVLYFELRRRLR